MTLQDLLLFTGAVYGASWVVSKSVLMLPLRERWKDVPFIGKLVHCIVCTSAWVSCGLTILLGLVPSSLFSPGFPELHPSSICVLVAWSVAATWVLAFHLRDAD